MLGRNSSYNVTILFLGYQCCVKELLYIKNIFVNIVTLHGDSRSGVYNVRNEEFK